MEHSNQLCDSQNGSKVKHPRLHFNCKHGVVLKTPTFWKASNISFCGPSYELCLNHSSS